MRRRANLVEQPAPARYAAKLDEWTGQLKLTFSKGRQHWETVLSVSMALIALANAGHLSSLVARELPKQTQNVEQFADEISYSPWRGGCESRSAGGLSCAMRREAHSGLQRVGVLVYGQEDSSRFLFVEVDALTLDEERSLVMRIDGQVLVNRIVPCRGTDPTCSTIIPVDSRLLKQLGTGTTLVIETRPRREIKLQFPLSDFDGARRNLL